MSSNDTLRQIRVSQPSRIRPSQPMSRRELAHLVNQYVWDIFQQRTGLDENYIGKLERGVVRWPNDVYRAGLRAVLGVGDDADLGFPRPRPSPRVSRGTSRRLGSCPWPWPRPPCWTP